MTLTRRSFGIGAAAGAMTLAGRPAFARQYTGPNIILIRFGGGVRRRETIEPATTYAPYTLNHLASRGILIPDMRIEKIKDGATSHSEGTLNLLTGRYLGYRNVGRGIEIDRLEPTHPTLFEYFREAFDVASHEVLLVNGEDRPQEEFFTFGMNPHYGIAYRSEMLSLHRFKLHKFARQITDPASDEATRVAAETALAELNAADHREAPPVQSEALEGFWDRWRDDYADDGFRNPRGDRLLTALALRAMAELRPRLMMINYQDPDYVHWGNASHYTRAIAIIDEGIEQVVRAADADPFYRDNTVFVVTPDCGRDANPLMDVPFQHHFNSREAHMVWAIIAGPGIVRGRVLDRVTDQTTIAPTIAALMGFRAHDAEASALDGILL